jgi:hypothetical protein
MNFILCRLHNIVFSTTVKNLYFVLLFLVRKTYVYGNCGEKYRSVSLFCSAVMQMPAAK